MQPVSLRRWHKHHRRAPAGPTWARSCESNLQPKSSESAGNLSDQLCKKKGSEQLVSLPVSVRFSPVKTAELALPWKIRGGGDQTIPAQ